MYKSKKDFLNEEFWHWIEGVLSPPQVMFPLKEYEIRKKQNQT